MLSVGLCTGARWGRRGIFRMRGKKSMLVDRIYRWRSKWWVNIVEGYRRIDVVTVLW